MMKVLGWTYDEQEKSYDVNGTVNEWGFIMPNHKGDSQ
jgi:hypothetical protein